MPTLLQRLFSRPAEPKPPFLVRDVSHGMPGVIHKVQLYITPSRGDILAIPDQKSPSEQFYRVIAVVHYPAELNRLSELMVKLFANSSNIGTWTQSVNPGSSNL